MQAATHNHFSTNGGRATKALMGAAAGAVGVWALDRADWFMWDHEDIEARWRTISLRPRHLPPPENLVSAASEAAGTELSLPAFKAAAQVVHYSIGITPAIGYALLRDRLPMDGVTRGALYGLGLFFAQDEVMNTLTGLGARPRD